MNRDRRSKARVCADCSKPIADRNASGKCKSCIMRGYHADPEWKAKHIAAAKAAQRTPGVRAKRSETAKKIWSDPAMRQKMSDAIKQSFVDDPAKRERRAKGGAASLRRFHATANFDWSAWHREQHAKRWAWLPADRRDEYRKLRVKLGAAEARRVIETDIVATERRRLAALSPFERQMEQLRKGAKLVPAFKPVRVDYDFTLGGIAPELG